MADIASLLVRQLVQHLVETEISQQVLILLRDIYGRQQ